MQLTLSRTDSVDRKWKDRYEKVCSTVSDTKERGKGTEQLNKECQAGDTHEDPEKPKVCGRELFGYWGTKRGEEGGSRGGEGSEGQRGERIRIKSWKGKRVGRCAVWQKSGCAGEGVPTSVKRKGGAKLWLVEGGREGGEREDSE